MRIIGGRLKKKRLFSVKGITTRPTSDRLRETIFNIISFMVQDAFVLDLFAGTGAMGIEALSRGAKEAIFIEKEGIAVKTIRKNIACCVVEKQSTVFCCNILKNLDCLKLYSEKIDLIFIDPPYCKNIIGNTLINLNRCGAVKLGATVIVEHSKLENIPKDIPNFILENQRVYGNTVVSFITYKKKELNYHV